MTEKKLPPTLKGLPEVKARPINREDAVLQQSVERMRNCPQCKGELRIVSNHIGINAHCGPCKRHWPIANTALRPESSASLPRGFHKETRVEPDWNIAFDNDVGEGNGSTK